MDNLFLAILWLGARRICSECYPFWPLRQAKEASTALICSAFRLAKIKLNSLLRDCSPTLSTSQTVTSNGQQAVLFFDYDEEFMNHKEIWLCRVTVSSQDLPEWGWKQCGIILRILGLEFRIIFIDWLPFKERRTSLFVIILTTAERSGFMFFTKALVQSECNWNLNSVHNFCFSCL